MRLYEKIIDNIIEAYGGWSIFLFLFFLWLIIQLSRNPDHRYNRDPPICGAACRTRDRGFWIIAQLSVYLAGLMIRY